MDVHLTKNGINRYWSIPILASLSRGKQSAVWHNWNFGSDWIADHHNRIVGAPRHRLLACSLAKTPRCLKWCLVMPVMPVMRHPMKPMRLEYSAWTRIHIQVPSPGHPRLCKNMGPGPNLQISWIADHNRIVGPPRRLLACSLTNTPRCLKFCLAHAHHMKSMKHWLSFKYLHLTKTMLKYRSRPKIPTPIEGGGGGQNQPVEFHFFCSETLG